MIHLYMDYCQAVGSPDIGAVSATACAVKWVNGARFEKVPLEVVDRFRDVVETSIPSSGSVQVDMPVAILGRIRDMGVDIWRQWKDTISPLVSLAVHLIGSEIPAPVLDILVPLIVKGFDHPELAGFVEERMREESHGVQLP